MIIPLNHAQVNYIFDGDALPTGAQVTFGLNLESFTGTISDLAALCSAAWMGSAWSDSLGAGCDLAQILVKVGPNATGPSLLIGAVDGGSLAGDATPNVAYLIHKGTAMGGRAGRGRFFLPGVVENAVGPSGLVTSTQLDALQLAANTYIGWMEDGDAPLYLLHGEGSPITEPTRINSLAVDTTVATQRRRLRR